MKTKKFIKLINNERLKTKVASEKGCVSSAVDVCIAIDAAMCSANSYDKCYKDYAACTKGADDICTVDVTACFGAGAQDYT